MPYSVTAKQQADHAYYEAHADQRRSASRARYRAIRDGQSVSRRDPLADRFVRHVDRRPDGCWLWTGFASAKGYGRINVDGVVELAHRVAYRLFVGPIPDGLTVDHLCAVKSCVNPDHLQPTTAIANFRRAMGYAREKPCGRGHDASRKVFRQNGWFAYCRDCRNANRRAHRAGAR